MDIIDIADWPIGAEYEVRTQDNIAADAEAEVAPERQYYVDETNPVQVFENDENLVVQSEHYWEMAAALLNKNWKEPLVAAAASKSSKKKDNHKSNKNVSEKQKHSKKSHSKSEAEKNNKIKKHDDKKLHNIACTKLKHSKKTNSKVSKSASYLNKNNNKENEKGEEGKKASDAAKKKKTKVDEHFSKKTKHSKESTSNNSHSNSVKNKSKKKAEHNNLSPKQKSSKKSKSNISKSYAHKHKMRKKEYEDHSSKSKRSKKTSLMVSESHAGKKKKDRMLQKKLKHSKKKASDIVENSISSSSESPLPTNTGQLSHSIDSLRKPDPKRQSSAHNSQLAAADDMMDIDTTIGSTFTSYLGTAEEQAAQSILNWTSNVSASMSTMDLSFLLPTRAPLPLQETINDDALMGIQMEQLGTGQMSSTQLINSEEMPQKQQEINNVPLLPQQNNLNVLNDDVISISSSSSAGVTIIEEIFDGLPLGEEMPQKQQEINNSPLLPTLYNPCDFAYDPSLSLLKLDDDDNSMIDKILKEMQEDLVDDDDDTRTGEQEQTLATNSALQQLQETNDYCESIELESVMSLTLPDLQAILSNDFTVETLFPLQQNESEDTWMLLDNCTEFKESNTDEVAVQQDNISNHSKLANAQSLSQEINTIDAITQPIEIGTGQLATEEEASIEPQVSNNLLTTTLELGEENVDQLAEDRQEEATASTHSPRYIPDPMLQPEDIESSLCEAYGAAETLLELHEMKNKILTPREIIRPRPKPCDTTSPPRTPTHATKSQILAQNVAKAFDITRPVPDVTFEDLLVPLRELAKSPVPARTAAVWLKSPGGITKSLAQQQDESFNSTKPSLASQFTALFGPPRDITKSLLPKNVSKTMPSPIDLSTPFSVRGFADSPDSPRDINKSPFQSQDASKCTPLSIDIRRSLTVPELVDLLSSPSDSEQSVSLYQGIIKQETILGDEIMDEGDPMQESEDMMDFNFDDLIALEPEEEFLNYNVTELDNNNIIVLDPNDFICLTDEEKTADNNANKAEEEEKEELDFSPSAIDAAIQRAKAVLARHRSPPALSPDSNLTKRMKPSKTFLLVRKLLEKFRAGVNPDKHASSLTQQKR